jgi:tRNA1(Val) A37 N6-methylase TrmN6
LARLVDDPKLGLLTDDRLTRDVWLLQRKRGHRFSSDDVATAFVAYEARPAARHVLDLGCGIGSVLLMLAWKLALAELVGIEAQELSFELLRRNVERARYSGRVRVVRGDLRDESTYAAMAGEFDLITGTPPYFPAGAALEAEDEQRAYARIEYRGGVDEYVAAGARRLARAGALVVCADARAGARVERAAAHAGLVITGHCDVIARAGRPALFTVWTMSNTAQCSQAPARALVLRDARGERTADAERLRAFCGLSNV